MMNRFSTERRSERSAVSRLLISLRDMLPQGVQRTISRLQYEYLSHMDREANMLYMNYGWAHLDPQAELIPLSDQDERNRYCIQLYHHVCSAVDLGDKDVLEVGCGRGGGASYIMRYLKPKSLVAVDTTANAIRFCSRHYDTAGLLFVRDKAESLQFDDNSFDVIVSIESSHCYASMEHFLNGACRVLRPEGYLLLADFRLTEQLGALRWQLGNCGLELLKEERLTPHVLRALDLDNERKQDLIKRKVPRILQGLFSEFAGMRGTRTSYGKLRTGDMEYLSFVLRK